MEKELNYDKDGLDPPRNVLEIRKKGNDDGTSSPPDESEQTHN